jgi:7-carboxy-7-deazaguanine synthase
VTDLEIPYYLDVNSIFGPTVQGEGPYAGRHCLFVRLARCNLSCSWCDTPQTWAYTERRAVLHRDGVVYNKDLEIVRMSIQEIMDKVKSLWPTPAMVVISGGEPLLQAGRLAVLARVLSRWGYSVHIETAGTLPPGLLATWTDAFIISPKLSNSGNPESLRLRWKVLEAFASWHIDKSWLKFVVKDQLDLFEVDAIVQRLQWPRDRVFCMPEGTTEMEIILRSRVIAQPVIERGYNLSLRTQTFVWGNEKDH